MKKVIAIVMIGLLIGLPISTLAKEISDYIVESNQVSDVKVNLFDYWLQEGVDITDPESRENFGINIDHLLLFHSTTNLMVNGQNKVITDFGRWNAWERDDAWTPVTGIVAPTLGNDGYPVLNISEDDIKATDWISNRNNESLAYLFNPDIDVEYRKVYKDVDGLFQYSQSRGEYYSSHENFAEYDEATNRFNLYSKPAINGVRDHGQFFPLNKASEVFNIENDDLVAKNMDSTNSTLNHYLGMTIETEFTQPAGGQVVNNETSQNENMKFTLTGDDDIWIYIDGVLVSDLGGIHNALTTEIDFATGKVTVKPGDENEVTADNTKEYYLGDVYEDALQDEEYVSNNLVKETDDANQTTRYTYKDGTTHTLKIFFLERGNTDSNFEIAFFPKMTGETPTVEEPVQPVQPTQPEVVNPETSDILMIAITAGVIAIVGMMVVVKLYQRRLKKSN